MLILVGYFESAIKLAHKIQEKAGKKLKDFLDALDSDEYKEEIAGYQADMREWMKNYPVPKSTIGQY